jgi:hypothetical protein
MKKLHIKRMGVDCMLDVELLNKDGDIWKFIVQYIAPFQDPDPAASYSVRLPEHFLRNKISKELDEDFIVKCLLDAMEKHADTILRLEPNSLVGYIEIWLQEAKENLVSVGRID